MRDFVACIDELSQLVSIAEQKKEFLRRLRLDCTRLPLKSGLDHDLPQYDSPEAKMTMKRVDWAMNLIEVQYAGLPAMIEDLRISLNTVSLLSLE